MDNSKKPASSGLKHSKQYYVKEAKINLLTNLLHSVIDMPPSPDKVIGRTLRAVCARCKDDGVHSGYILMVPWFHRANEMNNFCIPSKSVQ